MVATVLVMACSKLAGIGESDNDMPSTSPTTKTPSTETGGGNDRTDDNITIDVGNMDFGDLACGTESIASLVTIHNAGAKAATYKIVIPDGTAFRIDGALEGPLPAKSGLVTLKVFAKPERAAENTTDILVTAGDAVQTLHPKVHGSGATFEMMPAVVPFGDVRMQSGSAPIDVTVVNNGTVAAIVSGFDMSPDFAVDIGPSPLKIDPRGSATVHAMLKAGTESTTPLHADLKPILAQRLCGTAPSLALDGKRVNSTVTLSSGDFGKVNCASQNATKDIVISNYSGAMLSYSASLAATSAFTIVSGAAGMIPPGSSTTPSTKAVKVQPKPFGTNLAAIAEDLTIDITGVAAPDGGVRKVPLKVQPRGAIVTFTPQPQKLAFTSDGTTTDTKTFTAQNTGNDTIYIYWDFERTVGGPAWTYDPPSSLQPGQTRTGSVGFKPSTQGDNQAKLTPYRTTDIFGNGAASCTPLTPFALQGTKP